MGKNTWPGDSVSWSSICVTQSENQAKKQVLYKMFCIKYTNQNKHSSNF